MLGPCRAWPGDFDAARNLGYTELMERNPVLRKELAAGRAKGRATFAEVEESESDLHAADFTAFEQRCLRLSCLRRPSRRDPRVCVW